MGKAKGSPRTGGRQTGTPNRYTRTMKQAIEEVYAILQKNEGSADNAHFVMWATENPTEFYRIAAKLIPIQAEITGKDGGPIETRQVDEDADAFRRRLVSSAIAGATVGGTGETIQ